MLRDRFIFMQIWLFFSVYFVLLLEKDNTRNANTPKIVAMDAVVH